MASIADKAAEMFAQSFNCCQSVLATCGAGRGVPRDLAIRLGEGPGGGFGRMGNICGAVSGAAMAVGLKHNRGPDAKDAAGRAEAQRCVREFMRRFEEAHGSLVCRDLVGFDISTDAGYQAARDSGAMKELCPKFIRTAVEIVEDLLG